MEKYLSKIKPKHYGIVAFCLTCIAMYLMFAYEEVLSTGRYIILEGDLLQQYVPFTKMFVRDILRGENLWFSWSLSMGMNTALCYAYYVLNPFNLLYLILYPVDETIVTAMIIILKTGLAALFFQKFVSRKLKCIGVESVIFALFYALCSYNVIYNVLNIGWIDALYMLPLVTGLIIDYVKENKWKGLVLAYAYLFVTQFYMGYIVGIFSAVFFVIILFLNAKISIRQKLIKIGKFALIAIGAIGLVAIVLLPAFIFLIHNIVPSDDTVKLELNVLNIFSNLFWGQMQGTDGIYPYVYCGLPTLFLTPLFFGNKQINVRKKVGCGIILLLLLGCMLIEPAYLFMHAFDVPNGLGFRFSYLLSFVLCVIACYQYGNAQNIHKKSVLIVLGTEVILWIIALFFQPDIHYEAAERMKIIVIVFNIVFMILWCVVLWYCQKQNSKKILAAVICIFLASVEAASNGYICFRHEGAENLERNHNIYMDSMDIAMDKLSEDSDFYRVYCFNNMNNNSDAWFGYKGLTDFCSAVNVEYQNTMSQLGLMSTGNITYDVGINPIIKMIFAVKYDVVGTSPYIMALTIPAPAIYENPTALSLGYMVDKKIMDYQFKQGDAFYNMDELLCAMTNGQISCFDYIPDERITVEEENADWNYENGLYVIRKAVDNDDGGYIKFIVHADNDRAAYVQFQREYTYCAYESPILLGGDENSVYNKGYLTGAYAKELTKVDGGYEVVIEIDQEDVPAIAYQQANFCYYNQDELIKAYDILSQNQMVIREYGNTYIDAYVTVPEERTVLFTSIPYDEGWTVYVDGVETQTHAVVGDAFLALELEPGYHDLEFEYEAPGARMGMTVSGVSVGLYAGCILIEYMIKRKRKAKEGKIEPDVEDRTE